MLSLGRLVFVVSLSALQLLNNRDSGLFVIYMIIEILFNIGNSEHSVHFVQNIKRVL